jgi:carbonic anhydrase
MTRIIQGVLDFQRHVFDSKKQLFERLRDGQRPLALFVTCADSRINPNLLTQTEPGELFVLRNAGNLIPPHDAPLNGESAALEYAVRQLRVRDLILCGHSQCGAMQALLAPSSVANLPRVSGWIELARDSLDRARAMSPRATDDELLERVIEQNVLVQIEHLQTYPAVREAVLDGQLRLHAWVYQIESGQVAAYDASSQRFVPLAQSPRSKLLVPVAGPTMQSAIRSM